MRDIVLRSARSAEEGVGPEPAGLRRGGSAIHLTCHGKTDLGLRRELNEDTLYWSEKEGFAIVADGMGGRDFGEVASSLCVSSLNKAFKKYFPETLRGRSAISDPIAANALKQTIDTWLRDVNKAVHGFGSIDDRYQEMGTTVALVFHQTDFVLVAHVGDSRVYRVRDGDIEQMTEDHSFVNAQLRAGLITEEEAERSPYRNIITRAIGTSVKCKADINVFPAQPGDIYLLCSDGLSDLVNGREILATMQVSDLDLERSVQALIDLANERGGKDNITVLLARLDPDDTDR